ncbi:aldo/keto reductase [Indioceanicola profundi]|uniref:aldo/keto reductase n=1 Tax=Indioceanicola profundi TaxID=2220096 RepID=UPI0013C4BEB5|nr:aldo/keto reductase [Indioceanicola profundi]
MTTAPALSPVVVGCMRLLQWGLDAPGLRDWMKAAVDLGINSFDHADCYGGYTVEGRFGEALALEPGLRDRIVLIGKIGVMFDAPGNPVRTKHYNLSKVHLIERAERSLRELRTDRLDYLLLHRPDPLMNPDEVAAAITELKRSGKVLAFGVSNFSASQVRMLASRVEEPLVANQVEISLEHPDALFDGTLDACMQTGMVPMAWSPLGGGGLFRDPAASPELDRLRAVLWEVGQAHGGAVPDQVALAWLMTHPAGIRPLVGTGRLDRLAGAAGAARIKLDRQDWYRLLEAARGIEVP